MKHNRNHPHRKNVCLVRRDYQPRKADMEEELSVGAAQEELGQALLKPVDIQWIDKPKRSR